VDYLGDDLRACPFVGARRFAFVLFPGRKTYRNADSEKISAEREMRKSADVCGNEKREIDKGRVGADAFPKEVRRNLS
jgi:hypothetical protein